MCVYVEAINSVRPRNCFITQSNYVGYMFRPKEELDGTRPVFNP